MEDKKENKKEQSKPRIKTPTDKYKKALYLLIIFFIFIYIYKYNSDFINTNNNTQVFDNEDVFFTAKNTDNSNQESVFYDDTFYLAGNIGPVYNSVDIDYTNPDTLSVYEVRSGDNVDTVAKLYDVSPFTIMWANDLKSKTLKKGQLLLILPTSGIQHKIKKGDTLKSIAKKYNVSIYDIQEFNLINTDKDLVIGKEIVIPNGQISTPPEKKQTIKNKKGVVTYKNGITPIIKAYYNNISGYFIRPMTSGIKTQGIHGRNAIDIGTPVGTPVLASAGGVVLLARNSGYNGGYGTYIIISHPNGTQTLYGHLNRLNTQTGDSVSQGQIIGFSGNSGRSTGPHLHFEIIGAVNPF